MMTSIKMPFEDALVKGRKDGYMDAMNGRPRIVLFPFDNPEMNRGYRQGYDEGYSTGSIRLRPATQ